MFELIRALGLYNTLPGLILANLMLTLPFTVWVLTTFMRELPRELEEAALVDGATPLTMVRRIFLPLMAPAMVTTGLLSFIVAGAVVAASLALSLTAAYAFSRVSFRGRSALLMTILGVSMFPQVAVLSGMFELVRSFGLYNTLPGLILANLMLTLPFTVWVLTTFMRELPKEIEEAAYVDGATPWIVVRRVFLPLMAPAAVTTGLLAFIVSWNEFLFALTFTLTNERRTVPPAIALMSGSSAYELPWGTIMAASVIVTVPIIALVLVFQRKIVAGLTAGAVKG